MISQEQSRSLSPIVIGVVGHTRLRVQDTALLSQKVRDILGKLRDSHSHTPIIVVTSLAEGADQICADVALELGLEVIAPLPFPAELYETRFTTEAARIRLRELVCHPRVRAFCPTICHDERVSFAQAIVDEEARKARYAYAAVFVARHSHAMLALWDGEGEAKTSLTGELIDFKTIGRCPAKVDPIKSPAELGIVYHIFTPRPEWTPANGGEPGAVTILPRPTTTGTGGKKLSNAHELFEQTCALTENLNREIGTCPRPEGNDLLRGKKNCTVIENNLAQFRRVVANQSYRYKDRVDLAYAIVFVLAFVGALFLNIYEHISAPGEGLYWWPFVAALGCFASAWLYPMLFHTRKDEQRRLDSRALVEALRVQCYWHYARLDQWAPDHYLQRQRSELDWIRQSTRAWALRLQAEQQLTEVNNPERLETVIDLWLKEQADFYESSHRKNEAAEQFWKGASKVFVCISIVLAGLLFWPFSMSHPPEHPIPYLLFLSASLLAAAMTLAYGEKRLFAEHARHFEGMANLFRTVELQCRQLLKERRYEAVSDLLRQMGKEALAENTDWLILHRVRHFEVPAAG